MIMTESEFKAILNLNDATAAKWYQPITQAMEKFSINTGLRVAAFLAQVGHESGHFTRFEEGLNYSADGLLGIFKKYFPTRELATAYARKPQAIANRVYGGRMGNGPEASGEGYKYRGRGPIQLTGKFNYDAFSKAVGVDFVNYPDSLLDPYYGALAAGWFWNGAGLNVYADIGTPEAFDTITRKINGGTNGKPERDALFSKGRIILKV